MTYSLSPMEISYGLRLYFFVYLAILLELILHIALAAMAIFSSILQALLGVYWKYTCGSNGSIFSSTLPVELDLNEKILLS